MDGWCYDNTFSTDIISFIPIERRLSKLERINNTATLKYKENLVKTYNSGCGLCRDNFLALLSFPSSGVSSQLLGYGIDREG